MPSSISLHSSSRDVARALLRPIFPRIRARAERLPAPVAAQHRPAGHEDERQPRGERAHDQRGRGFVARAEQHRAVDRVAAQHFLRLHREQIAIEHRRRLHEVFAERKHRDFHRHPARLQHAFLHILREHLEMQVARVDLAPGIQDRDDRLALPILRPEPHLPRARAVAEAAQIIRAKPAEGAELFGRKAGRLMRPHAARRRAPFASDQFRGWRGKRSRL